jgi:hypothetical protein
LILLEEKMNATRLPKLVIAVCLVITAFIAYQIFQNTGMVAANSGASPSTGFGDLRRVESQQSLANSNSALPSIGFGNLRRVESQQSLANAASVPQAIGFGDLRRVESQQSLGSGSSASQSIGFGDLRLFEAEGQGYAKAVSPARQADIARWVGLGELYTNMENNDALRIQDAIAARWVAMGEAYSKLQGSRDTLAPLPK